jgi:hypothetical protein
MNPARFSACCAACNRATSALIAATAALVGAIRVDDLGSVHIASQ